MWSRLNVVAAMPLVRSTSFFLFLTFSLLRQSENLFFRFILKTSIVVADETSIDGLRVNLQVTMIMATAIAL